MTSAYLSQPVIFLIDVLFGLYMGIVALRILMQWAQWEYHNPIVQLIIKVTQLPVKFLRRFIPAIGHWDTATIVLLVSLAIAKILLISLFQANMAPFIMIFRLALADIFSLFITLFSASILIQVILSWFPAQANNNPVIPLISRLNAPLLRPIRRLLPAMSGIDFSPLIVLLGLQVIAMLVLPLLLGQV
ncbi:MAG: YggT family protein [Gammaproteobacteria bacterium]|nr:MAG: YggT family protein [Gammaproteobacteria bacterium]